MKLSWSIRLDPKSNDKCPYKRKAEGALTHKRRRHRAEGCVNREERLG